MAEYVSALFKAFLNSFGMLSVSVPPYDIIKHTADTSVTAVMYKENYYYHTINIMPKPYEVLAHDI